jgi:hypothetical protein
MNTSVNTVSEDFFEVLSMRLIAGRGYRRSDSGSHKPIPAVVNQTFAKRFFPELDPMGRKFGRASDNAIAEPAYEIIGVVNEAKYRSLREPPHPVLYGLWNPDPRWTDSVIVHVRSHGNPLSVIPDVQRVLRQVGPGLPFYESQTLRQQIDNSLWSERVPAMLATFLSGIAALLAAVGFHGLVAYTATRRTREIGIRVSLGATRLNVIGLISRDTLGMVLAGMLAGAAVTLVLAPKFDRLLYGVSPRDPLVLSAACLLMLGIAAAGSLMPATNALRIQPAASLRCQ